MSRESVQSGDVGPADDLTRIEGIGPKIARLLNTAGIRTFEDLAERSARDIAGLIPGIARMPSARPAVWRSEAQKLAAASPAQTDSQHYESFGVTVLVDEEGSIRDTRMEHLRTREVRRWAGWVPEAMLDFVMRATAGTERQADAGERRRKVPDDGGGGPVTAAPARPREHAWRGTLSAGLSIERSVLRAGQPFSVTMRLDLTGVTVTAERLVYNAVIEANPLGTKARRTLARVEGLLAASETPEIAVEAAALPPGAYRLLGAVSLREPGATAPGGLAAVAEGMMVQVLAA